MKKSKKMIILRRNLQFLFFFQRRLVIFFGNYAIGGPIALMILQLAEALLRGDLQDLQRVWRQFPWILTTIRHTLFRILVVHDQWDLERQSEDF